MTKSEINGDKQEALWTFLKESIPYPYDDRGGTGSDFIYQLQPNDKPIQWSPVRRNDVSWNFEKFLILPNGQVHRFRPTVKPDATDIISLIEANLPN